jgi:hypothetical protein
MRQVLDAGTSESQTPDGLIRDWLLPFLYPRDQALMTTTFTARHALLLQVLNVESTRREIYGLDPPLTDGYDRFNVSCFATLPGTKSSHASTQSSNVEVPLFLGSTALGLRRSNDHDLIGVSQFKAPGCFPFVSLIIET